MGKYASLSLRYCDLLPSESENSYATDCQKLGKHTILGRKVSLHASCDILYFFRQQLLLVHMDVVRLTCCLNMVVFMYG